MSIPWTELELFHLLGKYVNRYTMESDFFKA